MPWKKERVRAVHVRFREQVRRSVRVKIFVPFDFRGYITIWAACSHRDFIPRVFSRRTVPIVSSFEPLVVARSRIWIALVFTTVKRMMWPGSASRFCLERRWTCWAMMRASSTRRTGKIRIYERSLAQRPDNIFGRLLLIQYRWLIRHRIVQQYGSDILNRTGCALKASFVAEGGSYGFLKIPGEFVPFSRFTNGAGSRMASVRCFLCGYRAGGLYVVDVYVGSCGNGWVDRP
jgi:hypothetical protein